MLKIKQLKKLFNSKAIAGLHGIDLEIEKPGVYALMGPSGCGKTTLLNILNSKIEADSGEFNTFKNSIMLMPKISDLDFEKSCLENLIEFNLKKDQLPEEKLINLAREVLMLLEITSEIHKTPDQLSAGQLQRLIIGCCLVNSPDILMLDEPFSILDWNSKTLIIEDMLDIAKEKEMSLLWVTHDFDEAFQYCDKIAMMNFGKIIQFDTPKKIYQKPNSLFSAHFLGVNNILSFKMVGDQLDFGFSKLEKKMIKTDLEFPCDTEHGLFVIRPHHLFQDDKGPFKATIKKIRYLGDHYNIHCTSHNDVEIIFSCQDAQNLNIEQKIRLNFEPEHVHIIHDL